jgi:hypothetical protein
VSPVAGPAESTQARGNDRQVVQHAGQLMAPRSVLGECVMAADQCVRAWEGAYRHYGRMWELAARAPKGDPAAAREMATASRAVAAAWRAIEAATTLSWWTIAALQPAAAAFDEQAQKYDENSENPSYKQGR